MPAADLEPPYCGVCVAALDGDRCPVCDAIWVPASYLTQAEARTFRAAFTEGAGDVDDVRWGNAWLAVDRERTRAAVH